MNEALAELDKVRLNFSDSGLLVMNIILALIMFGVALEINVASFKHIFLKPKSLIVGLISQYVLLPAATFLLILLIKPSPAVAFGMILVASCPSGNIANFLSLLSKGNVELSISLTAIATLIAVFMTPLNFEIYGNLYNKTSHLLTKIEVDFMQMVKTVLLLLGIPLALGTLFTWKFPVLSAKITKPMKIFSLIAFAGFIGAAFAANFEYFVKYIYWIIILVFIQNSIAFLIGYYFGKLTNLNLKDRKTICIETGIHNSGLALVLIFNPKLFNGLGGMAFVAAWWGIWHIIAGLGISWFLKRKI
jgi:BASS family bile acid:Na+ symporter